VVEEQGDTIPVPAQGGMTASNLDFVPTRIGFREHGSGPLVIALEIQGEVEALSVERDASQVLLSAAVLAQQQRILR
jgi:hypothetical protein